MIAPVITETNVVAVARRHPRGTLSCSMTVCQHASLPAHVGRRIRSTASLRACRDARDTSMSTMLFYLQLGPIGRCWTASALRGWRYGVRERLLGRTTTRVPGARTRGGCPRPVSAEEAARSVGLRTGPPPSGPRSSARDRPRHRRQPHSVSRRRQPRHASDSRPRALRGRLGYNFSGTFQRRSFC